MRILHVVASEKWTGAAAVVWDWTQALAAAGAEAQCAFVRGGYLERRLSPSGAARPLFRRAHGFGSLLADRRRLRDTLLRERFGAIQPTEDDVTEYYRAHGDDLGGRPLPFSGPYLWLYEFVPGFDGLRVPARLAMVAYVGLTVLAGYGLAVLDRQRRGAVWMGALAVFVMVETTAAPFETNLNFVEPGLAKPPGRVRPAAEAPAVYRLLAGLPPSTVVAEFPFGFPSWELRYVYYSSVHWQRLLNGYSGGFPASYTRNAAALSWPVNRPEIAWDCLVRNRVTHVVVHRTAYLGEDAQPVVDWLTSHGAHHLATFREDEVFELPR